jgi:acetyl esterase/lipase
MDARSNARRLLVGLASLGLLAGCATGAPTPVPASATPTNVPSVAVASPTPAPTPSVVETDDIAYESANPVLVPGVLDVYAPAKAGPWPVVVMLHGGPPMDKVEYREYASRVADLGFVVFVPTWGAGDGEPDHDGLLAAQAQAACATAFAQAHAAEYGGDPQTTIVFGHSAGANMGALVAFRRPEPTPGCLGGTTLGAIDALVTWEGDWLAYDPRFIWDRLLAADHRIFDGYTPWSYLGEQRDLRVVMLVSEDPGIPERQVSDPPAADSWLAARDPSGDLFRQLKADGALVDSNVDVADLQQLLFSALKAQGNPVSLDVMPGSTHLYLSDAGWKVFLAAFPKAAAHD